MKFFKRLSITDDNKASIFLRVSFAIMMIPHGAGKLFGIWGGFGFEKTLHHFTENMAIPFVFAVLAILIEFFSAIAILVGYQTRINAFLLACVMFVAGLMHLEHGFYMNWFGQKAGEGFEFHIIAVGMMLALAVLGGGKYSLDRKLNLKD
ncbi:MAG TPA: DoxX family protein [Arcobacter sp.]|nr:DoxX family protein [Arcobacter sp.]